jgi:hypothetical protein
LADDIVTAHIHWRLHCDLVDALNQKHIAHAQSPTPGTVHLAGIVRALLKTLFGNLAILVLLFWSSARRSAAKFGPSTDRLALASQVVKKGLLAA